MALLLRIAARAPLRRAATRRFSDSITYSGGQASTDGGGQGGFYGSGGARAKRDGVEWNPECCAQLTQVTQLNALMEEVEALEESIRGQDGVLEGVIEKKGSIKKLMTSPDTVKLIESLEAGGQPVWGLSAKERCLVRAARSKVNEC